MIGRPRNISREVSALELRAAGESQAIVAQRLGISVRSVARYEQRWRRGDRPLPEVLAALWSAYDQEQHAWRRIFLLQGLAKVAFAQAEDAKLSHGLAPRARSEQGHEEPVTWRAGIKPEVVGIAQQMIERARQPV